MPFITNQGQVAKEVGFYAKTFRGTVYVTRRGEIVYSLTKKDLDQASAKGDKEKKGPNVQVSVLKERLLQAKTISPVGVEKSVTRVNYFIGSNKDKWKTNVSSYYSVSLGEVYDHIDFALRAHGNNVEKIFTVNPKGKVEDVRAESRKVRLQETLVDEKEWTLTRQIFDSPLDLSQKLHLKLALDHVTEIADRAEDAADRLELAGLKSVI